MTYFALHGFLGSPLDWQGEMTHVPNLFSQIAPFWEWAKNFNRYAEEICDQERILVGYSMGGRLALHALIDNPTLWKRAVILSANPGICSNPKERIMADQAWAKRFEEEPWDELMLAWNEQAVFGGKAPQRQEKDFSRNALSKALTTWSLGKQENLLEKIEALSIPILWLTGERDVKFTALAEQVKLSHPHSEKRVVEGATHRLPWELDLTAYSNF